MLSGIWELPVVQRSFNATKLEISWCEALSECRHIFWNCSAFWSRELDFGWFICQLRPWLRSSHWWRVPDTYRNLWLEFLELVYRSVESFDQLELLKWQTFFGLSSSNYWCTIVLEQQELYGFKVWTLLQVLSRQRIAELLLLWLWGLGLGSSHRCWRGRVSTRLLEELIYVFL